MKLSKSQAGFTPVHALLGLVIISIIGFAGWKVYNANKSAKLAESSSQTSTTKKQDSQSAESKIPEGWVEYKNEELGFKFAYPKEWGEVKVSFMDNGPFTREPASFGKAYELTFSNEPRGVFSACVKSSRFSAGPKGPISTSYLLCTGWISKDDKYYANGLGYGDLRIIDNASVVKLPEEALYSRQESNPVGFGESYAYTFNLRRENLGALSIQASGVAPAGTVENEDTILLKKIAETVGVL